MANEDVDWAGRYQASDTPWDLGGPHPELSARLQDGRLAPDGERNRALVVGAGLGHDALALARRGWAVTAVDRVDELAERVGPVLAREGAAFVVGDALEFDSDRPFDLIWDHTFFCAIDPSDRVAWGARAGLLMAPGGRYVSLVFPVGKPADEGGPPHGMSAEVVTSVLGALFRVAESVAVTRAVPRRTWREQWLELRKAALSPHPSPRRMSDSDSSQN